MVGVVFAEGFDLDVEGFAKKGFGGLVVALIAVEPG